MFLQQPYFQVCIGEHEFLQNAKGTTNLTLPHGSVDQADASWDEEN
jgi:hypothetical protein